MKAVVLPNLVELTDPAEKGLRFPSGTGSKDGTPLQGSSEGNGDLYGTRRIPSLTGTERLDRQLSTEAILPPRGVLEIL